MRLPTAGVPEIAPPSSEGLLKQTGKEVIVVRVQAAAYEQS
jgi:hypothetical protein